MKTILFTAPALAIATLVATVVLHGCAPSEPSPPDAPAANSSPTASSSTDNDDVAANAAPVDDVAPTSAAAEPVVAQAGLPEVRYFLLSHA